MNIRNVTRQNRNIQIIVNKLNPCSFNSVRNILFAVCGDLQVNSASLLYPGWGESQNNYTILFECKEEREQPVQM